MQNFSPTLNLPTRKVKGLVKLFAGHAAPWYFTEDTVVEGMPMIPTTTTDKITKAVMGSTHGAKVIGLALQETYDDAAFGQLKGYHFANDTRQRLDGNPIGLLCGYGWAATNCYWGSVTYGDQAAVGPSGKLVKAGQHGAGADDLLPIVFEGSGSNGTTLIRIRYDFPLNALA